MASLSLAEMPTTGLLGGLTNNNKQGDRWEEVSLIIKGSFMLLSAENPYPKRTANLIRRSGSQGGLTKA